MAKITLTIEEAQIALKNYYNDNYAFSSPVSIEVTQLTVATNVPNKPHFPEITEFIKQWQHQARSDNKIQIIKAYGEWQTSKGFINSSLFDTKQFVEAMFYQVTI